MNECPHNKWNGHLCRGQHECLKTNRKVTTKYHNKYCYSPNYVECSIYQKNKEKDCFFTTILCEFLGQPFDENLILKNLNEFRKKVLEQDKQYEELLIYHDRISPLIADAIRNTSPEMLKEFIELIYTAYLLPINNFITIKDTKNAIRRYEKMRELLIVNFSLGQQYAYITYHYKHPEKNDKKTKKRIPIGLTKGNIKK